MRAEIKAGMRRDIVNQTKAEFLDSLKKINPNYDLDRIGRAFDVADRKSVV